MPAVTQMWMHSRALGVNDIDTLIILKPEELWHKEAAEEVEDVEREDDL